MQERTRSVDFGNAKSVENISSCLESGVVEQE
jgi:hypothetical protein